MVDVLHDTVYRIRELPCLVEFVETMEAPTALVVPQGVLDIAGDGHVRVSASRSSADERRIRIEVLGAFQIHLPLPEGPAHADEIIDISCSHQARMLAVADGVHVDRHRAAIQLIVLGEAQSQGIRPGKDYPHPHRRIHCGQCRAAVDEIIQHRYLVDEYGPEPFRPQDIEIPVHPPERTRIGRIHIRGAGELLDIHVAYQLTDHRGLAGAPQTVQDADLLLAPTDIGLQDAVAVPALQIAYVIEYGEERCSGDDARLESFEADVRVQPVLQLLEMLLAFLALGYPRLQSAQIRLLHILAADLPRFIPLMIVSDLPVDRLPGDATGRQLRQTTVQPLHLVEHGFSPGHGSKTW